MKVQKRVLVNFIIPLECEVPADWGKDMIEFFYNGSSHCVSNEWDRIIAKVEAEDCPCRVIDAAYVKDL